jgi:hypothetical protein
MSRHGAVTPDSYRIGGCLKGAIRLERHAERVAALGVADERHGGSRTNRRDGAPLRLRRGCSERCRRCRDSGSRSHREAGRTEKRRSHNPQRAMTRSSGIRSVVVPHTGHLRLGPPDQTISRNGAAGPNLWMASLFGRSPRGAQHLSDGVDKRVAHYRPRRPPGRSDGSVKKYAMTIPSPAGSSDSTERRASPRRSQGALRWLGRSHCG